MAIALQTEPIEPIAGETEPILADGDPDPVTPVPRPVTKDAASRQQYYNALNKKYGGYMKDRADWGDFTDWQVKNKPGVTIGSAVNQISGKYGIKPELLYSSAMEEGMRKLFPRHDNPIGEGSGDEQFPIAGYETFGLDTFADQYPALVKRGYLDSEFAKNFKGTAKVNELGQKVNSANFKDVDDALLAKAAMIKMSKDDLDQYITENKINLSDKGKEFFSLVAYNAGINNAKKMISSYNKNGFLKDDKYLEKQPSASWKAPYENAMKRVFMANALKNEQYFK